MTPSEEAAFLQADPMLAIESMPASDFESLFRACRKFATPQFKRFREDKKVQLANDLQRQEEKVKANQAQKEKRENEENTYHDEAPSEIYRAAPSEKNE